MTIKKVLHYCPEPRHIWDKLFPVSPKLSVKVYGTSGGQEREAKKQQVKKEGKNKQFLN